MTMRIINDANAKQQIVDWVQLVSKVNEFIHTVIQNIHYDYTVLSTKY